MKIIMLFWVLITALDFFCDLVQVYDYSNQNA